jgi:large subunit ribosomal protein L25
MAESVQLICKERTTQGTQAARHLRRQGLLPAVLYGHKKATRSFVLNRDEFEKALRHGVRIVNLKSEGEPEQALIQEVQWDHLGKDVLHVDFRRVSKDERVVVPVPVHLRGIAPGVNAGGMLDQPLHVLEVECLATAVPDAIRVNISELQLDAFIFVRDLQLPPDVKVMADPDAIVVHITPPLVEAAAPAAEAPEQAEPEVIGRVKAAEEGEEEKK